MINNEKGFTLVELMISILLGLLIMVATIMLFGASQKLYYVQSDITAKIGNINIVIEVIKKSLEKTYQLDNILERTSPNIVFSSKDFNSNLQLDAKYFTSQTNTLSPFGKKNDQLVLKYKPIRVGERDCTGKAVVSTSIYVVEKYFLKKDDANPKSFVIACDSGRFDAEKKTLSGLNGQGVVLMKGVDYFHILISIKRKNSFRQVSINEYLRMIPNKDIQIVAIQLGLVYQTGLLNEKSLVKSDQKLRVLDQILNYQIGGGETSSTYDVANQTITIDGMNTDVE